MVTGACPRRRGGGYPHDPGPAQDRRDSRQAGVSVRTVGYCTSRGLITPAARSDGSLRFYDPAVVERITTVRQLESLGVGLDAITAALGAPHYGDIADLIGCLDRDLHTLQAAADTVADGYGLPITAMTRAYNLITAALDIASSLPPGP